MTDQVAQQGAVVEKGAGVPQDARVLDGGMGSKAPDVAAIHALVTACEALGKEAAVCYQGAQANSRLGNGYAEVAEHLRVVDGHLLNARAALVLGADEPIAAALRTVASFDRSARSARYDATSAAVAANASISRPAHQCSNRCHGEPRPAFLRLLG